MMLFIVTMRYPDPIAKDQSKYRDSAGQLRYSADDTYVYPGPSGVRASLAYEMTRAATTLTKAHEVAVDFAITQYVEPDMRSSWANACRRIPEAGGTIGPLPNGVVIHMEPVSPLALAARIPTANGEMLLRCLDDDDDFARLVDAYNATQLGG
jgi:hypothetical protein